MQYRQLHYWVEKQLGKPMLCWHCNSKAKQRYEWSNISGKYKKDISDWQRLCLTCHRKYDGLHAYASGRTHCKHGHAYTPENTRTRVEKDNGLLTRICRECQRRHRRNHRVKLRLAKQGVVA